MRPRQDYIRIAGNLVQNDCPSQEDLLAANRAIIELLDERTSLARKVLRLQKAARKPEKKGLLKNLFSK